VCWEICNVQRIHGNGQTAGRRVQNCEKKDAETKGEEGRVELSLLVFNLGVQCYILSMDETMSIQQATADAATTSTMVTEAKAVVTTSVITM
jgi:hypothetical protein